MRNLGQVLLFIAFFSIGAAAVSLSVLCDDLLAYYTNKHLLNSAKQSQANLESLIADYDALLKQLQNDPNLLERIAPATLGTEPKDEDTVYPRVTPEQLNAARKALIEDTSRDSPAPAVPAWLERCSRPPHRTMLFVAGAFLIVIAFVCFGPVEKSKTHTEPEDVGPSST